MKFLLNMVKKSGRSNKPSKGYALPVVLVLLALFFSLLSFLLADLTKEFAGNMKNRDYEICLLTAKNAMEAVKSEIEKGQNDMAASHVLDPNGGTYSYQVLKTGQNLYKGQISSQYGQYKKQFMVSAKTQEASFDIVEFTWKMER